MVTLCFTRGGATAHHLNLYILLSGQRYLEQMVLKILKLSRSNRSEILSDAAAPSEIGILI
jgi:hypothetical protein